MVFSPVKKVNLSDSDDSDETEDDVDKPDSRKRNLDLAGKKLVPPPPPAKTRKGSAPKTGTSAEGVKKRKKSFAKSAETEVSPAKNLADSQPKIKKTKEKEMRCRWATGCKNPPKWCSGPNEQLPKSCDEHKQTDHTFNWFDLQK